MKLKEKLARRYASYRCTTGNEHLDRALADVTAWGFEAGFEKCREMAHAIADEYSSREGTKGQSTEIGEAICQLGEEEVE